MKNQDHWGQDLDAAATLLHQNPDNTWKKGRTRKLEDARVDLLQHNYNRRKNRRSARIILLSKETADQIEGENNIPTLEILKLMAKERVEANKKNLFKPSKEEVAKNPNLAKTYVWLVRLPKNKFFVIAVEKPWVHPQAHANMCWYRSSFTRHAFPVETPRLTCFPTSTKKATQFRAKTGSVITKKDACWELIPEIQKTGFDLPAELEANQLWHVHYECRESVIAISPNGEGFFAPGQEPCWHFSAVEKWIQQITTPHHGKKRKNQIRP